LTFTFGKINQFGVNPLDSNQPSWKESFTYDANGNRTSKTTGWVDVFNPRGGSSRYL
jgi:YD repeat-containing protein